jgi:alcohol dehydrogenase
MAARDYPEMLTAIAAGRLDPGLLVTRTITLDQAPAALVGMGGPGRPGTTVIELDG